MDITKDIQPMTTFRNHSAEIMQHLKDTKRPVVLTVNGKAAAVVQDAEAYQHLLDLAAEANAAEGIRQGFEDVIAGRSWPARQVFDEYVENMAYRVEVTQRAVRDLRRIYQTINAGYSDQAAAWFNGLESLVISLEDHPLRGASVPENGDLRQLFYGAKPNVYRIIYAINEPGGVVRVLHIRHGARQDHAPGAV